MVDEKKQQGLGGLPQMVADFIASVIKKMRYRKKVRREVQAELTSHFEDALDNCSNEQKDKLAQELIINFGNSKLLATLIRRGKKRFRPLWVQALAKVGQAAVLLIILFALYTVWFITGKSNPRIDYMSVLNEMGRSAVLQEDNAWPMYEKAGKLYVQPDEMIKELGGSYWEIIRKTDSMTDIQKAAMEKWIEENEAAWQQLVAGSLKRQFYRELAYTGDEDERRLRDFAIPLEPFRELLWLARWHIWMNLEEGRLLQAARDCLVMVRVARTLQGKHNHMQDHLLASLYSRVAYVALRDIVNTGKLTITELKQIQDELAKIYKDGFPYISIGDHILIILDAFQHGFTEGGPGGGHMTLTDLAQFLKWEFGMRDKKTRWYMPAVALGAGMIHVGRDETLAKTNELWNHMNADLKKTPYEREISGSNMMEFLSTLPKYRYFLVHSTPDFWYRAEAVHRVKAEYKATMAIFALKRWQLEKGQYPENLAELTDECYLKQPPMDPYSDKPLVYRRTDNGLMLYSVGPNFKDDGGVEGKKEEGSDKYYAQNGDVVYWPVGENW
jgi:hypothetical protein